MGTNEKDMTAGSPGKLIITFAIPMMLGNIFQRDVQLHDHLQHKPSLFHCRTVPECAFVL